MFFQWPFIFLLLALQSFAREENYRYMVDPHSCGEDGVELINGWMKDATAWAQMAAEAVADGIPDERIKKQFLRMFTSGSMSYVREAYLNLARFTPFDGTYTQWEGERNMYDVEIHCNIDRIERTDEYQEQNVGYKDLIQETPIKNDDSILKYKRPLLTTSMAVTSTRATDPNENEQWNPQAPEIITINPVRMRQYKLFKPELDEKHIQKAMHPGVRGTLKLHAPMFILRREWKPVDLLDTPAQTMLHEMTHTVSVAESNDGRGDDAVYGWVKVIENRISGSKTADNLAYFAMLVKLIKDFGYDVDEDGNIFKIE